MAEGGASMAAGSSSDGVGVGEEGDDSNDADGLALPAGAARREPAEPPPLPEGVPPLAQILRGKQPAKELLFNVVDLIYCYAYVRQDPSHSVLNPQTR